MSLSRLFRPRLPFAVILFALAGGAAASVGRPSVARAEEVTPTTLPPVLSFAEARRIFRTKGLDLLLADASIQSAEADLKSAGAAPNPALNLGFGKSIGYDPAAVCRAAGATGCDDKQYQIGLSDQAALTDTLYGKRSLRRRVAQAALDAAKLGRADAERTVGFAVKQAYIAVAAAKRQVAFALEVVDSNVKTLDLFTIKFNRGAVNEADLARIETQKLEADQGVDAAKAALRAAKVQLAFLLGVRGAVPDYDVDEAILAYSVPAALQGTTPEKLLKVAIEHRPDLRGIQLQEQRAEASIDLAKRQRLPDLTLSLSYSQQGTGNSAISPPTVLGAVSLPIPVFYQQQGEVLRAQADLRAQALTRQKTQAQIVSEIEAGYSAFTSAQARVQRMEGRLVERARRARDLVKLQNEKGAASLLEVLDAQRTFIATMTEYLQNLSDYWTAIVSIEEATGVELVQ